MKVPCCGCGGSSEVVIPVQDREWAQKLKNAAVSAPPPVVMEDSRGTSGLGGSGHGNKVAPAHADKDDILTLN